MAQTYDFHTLSPLDFEELVRDVLQAHWGKTLETFGAGRDGGIDARYLDGPNKTIIQAKHYIGSGFKALLKAVSDERPKAVALRPTRYIIATSVSLSPDRKDKIQAAIPGVPVVPQDILGQEDLNNLLGLYPEVEKQHFKLWLSSTAVLERILLSGVYNRTAAELDIIKHMVPKFVQNQSIQDAEQKLSETGALIIAGPPGVGKTTLARMLLWLHAEQDWKIYVVDSLEDALKVADPTEKRLILLDDFLGQVRLSADHVREVDARLPPLLSRVAAHQNLRFILTTRDYILAQARGLSNRLARGKTDAREYVLNVGSYTRAVRARILYNHLYFSALSSEQREEVLADDFFLKIIDHKNFNPRIIEEVTAPDYLALNHRSIPDTISAVLENPELLWETPYRQHITAEGRMLMIALFLNGRGTSVERLKRSFVRIARALGTEFHPGEIEATFRSTYKALEGSVLGLSWGIVSFTNPGLRDFLQSVICADKLSPVLLPELETYSELSELWAVQKSSQTSSTDQGEPAVGMWVDALDRLDEADTASIDDYLGLAIDIYRTFEDEGLEARLEKAIGRLEQMEFENGDVGLACSLIELGFSATLPIELNEKLRTYTTNAAANLLINEANALSFEDLQSLDDALHDYGNDDSLAQIASEEAIARFAGNIDNDLEQIETIEDLDEFESTLTEFMSKRGVSPSRVSYDFQYRRERLAEVGKFAERGSYRGTSSWPSKTEASDDEIRSMFSGLS
jgi:energy-coupling factor transporter ATP-binding protein EcfA2